MSAIKREEVIGPCRLLLGDCLDILPTLCADVVITDPPYGVGLGVIKSRIGKTGYNGFDDTPEYVSRVAVPVIRQSIQRFGRVVCTPGARCAFSYPQPDEIGAIHVPAGAGLGRWGFITSHPVLFYGADPLKRRAANSYQCNKTSERNGHPCPKPIEWMEWAVRRSSLACETVLDPFMGSGTTGVACVKLGRRFTGIEIDETYFDIACERIRKAVAQPDMFVDQPPAPTPTQEALL